MDNDLQGTLRELLRSGTESNAALNALLDDYTRYHATLVVVGGLFLVAVILLAVFFWIRFGRSRRGGSGASRLERNTYLAFGVLTVVVALFLGLVLAANISTVRDPRQGFTGSIRLLDPSPAEGSRTETLYGAVNTWLQSGTAQVPEVLQERIDDRLSWQRPKAIITSALLVGFAVAAALMWRALIRRSRASGRRWGLPDTALLVGGVVAVGACLLLMLMVMGNTQGAISPTSLTLFFS